MGLEEALGSLGLLAWMRWGCTDRRVWKSRTRSLLGLCFRLCPVLLDRLAKIEVRRSCLVIAFQKSCL